MHIVISLANAVVITISLLFGIAIVGAIAIFFNGRKD